MEGGSWLWKQFQTLSARANKKDLEAELEDLGNFAYRVRRTTPARSRLVWVCGLGCELDNSFYQIYLWTQLLPDTEFIIVDHMSFENLDDCVRRILWLAMQTSVPLVFMGYSIGSGIVALAAAKCVRSPDALVLLAPFRNLSAAVPVIPIKFLTRLAMGNELDTKRALQFVECPVLIVAGKKDQMFPSRRNVDVLKNVVNEKGKLPTTVMVDSDHSNVIRYRKEVCQWLHQIVHFTFRPTKYVSKYDFEAHSNQV
jgi:alpha/beta superfamily hydrolase